MNIYYHNLKYYTLAFVFMVVNTCLLAQDRYYPEGTRWELVKCEAPKDKGFVAYGAEFKEMYEFFDTWECVVEGDTVIYNVKKDWGDQAVQDSVRYKKVVTRVFDRNHYLTRTSVVPFRECGDSIFTYNISERFAYNFNENDWHEGGVAFSFYGGTISADDVEQILLNDGNYYDYQPGLMLIRTVGSLKSGVIPNVDFGRSGYFYGLAYFIRHGVLIFQNDKIVYPEGYIASVENSQISKSPSAEDTIYTLQGIRLKETDARPKGIYIKNRRKIVK